MTRFCTSCTKPTGTICLSSPRRARLRMPPRSRALSTCSSASLIVPFRPNNKRSLKCAGSYNPSSSRMSVSASAHNSRSLCQSVELRASRDTSRPSTIPTRPRLTSVTSRWKPSRSAALAPDCPSRCRSRRRDQAASPAPQRVPVAHTADECSRCLPRPGVAWTGARIDMPTAIDARS